MKRYLYILTVVMAVMLGAHSGTAQHCDSAQWSQAMVTGNVCTPLEEQGVAGCDELMPLDATEAALLQVRVVNRVCQSRPQRTISSQGSRLVRSQVRSAISTGAVTGKSLRVSREMWTAPFTTPAPTDYYVFALKRLLC